MEWRTEYSDGHEIYGLADLSPRVIHNGVGDVVCNKLIVCDKIFF